jgi:hypothetical protein
MQEHEFKLFMSRFDTIESAIKTYHERMQAHVDEDNQIHEVVQRHSTYWKFVFLGVPVVGGWVATKLGWK